MALKVGELFASFNLDTSGIDGAVKSAENKMANLGKSLAIGGAAMTAAVTVPLKQAASAIYEAGSGFDAQMSKVFAIAGSEVTGSAEAMEALRQKALEMGSTTQFTASEAGEAMEYMAMAGWKTDQMLAAIGPLMNLAAAAGADLGTTSDIVTDAMTAFGYAATDTVTVVKDGVKMEVNAVEHFADVLAAASSNSNTNVTMLGESFKFAAPLAGALGYSVDDVAIALGLMANNGIKSSMAGTSLSRIIQNMAKPSDQTAAAMEALGVSLYNSKGEAKSLREIMGDFRGQAKKNGVDVSKLAADVADLDEQYASGKLTEEQYTAKLEELTAGSGDFLKNLTQLAGARGLPGLLAIMNATDEDFEKLCGSIDNATGSASEMKRVMLDNAKGDITLFKSALEGLEITLWGLAENGFRKVVQEATKYVDAFRNADKSTQVGVLKMGALAAAIGPAMAGMGGL
ncbi:MAG: phage tail tape measure protein, partial [Clostridiales bacterium]|nr:phage tail tape measure protein [Clostridiales bacterium]